jgi:RNA polymerase sigma-54 factor
MALQQRLQQKLQQRLSPQQIQLMKLLQVPTASLETRIKEELEENPALELEPPRFDEQTEGSDESETPSDHLEPEQETIDYDNVNVSEYIQDDENEPGDYRLKDDNIPELSAEGALPIQSGTTFYDLLLDQLQLLNLSEKQQIIAEQIVGSIDEDGYLRRDTSAMVDDLAFRQNVMATTTEVEQVIAMIQQFDPPGVAARDLRECLLIQLHRRPDQDALVLMAIRAITAYFDEFSKR